MTRRRVVNNGTAPCTMVRPVSLSVGHTEQLSTAVGRDWRRWEFQQGRHSSPPEGWLPPGPAGREVCGPLTSEWRVPWTSTAAAEITAFLLIVHTRVSTSVSGEVVGTGATKAHALAAYCRR